MLEVSIIIPVYNGISYIDRCLEAIVSSGAPADKYEIIAVDDNSTDASLVKLQEWESKTENMRVYHRRKAGPGGARNLGLITPKAVISCLSMSMTASIRLRLPG